MDKLDAITTRLGAKELEALRFFVQKADECGSQHLSWDATQKSKIRMSDCGVQFPNLYPKIQD